MVQVAEKRPSAVGIDLVNSDSNLATSLDLSHSARRQGILCVLSNIDVSFQFRATALIGNVGHNFGVADDGGILLARIDTDAVTSNGGVD